MTSTRIRLANAALRKARAEVREAAARRLDDLNKEAIDVRAKLEKKLPKPAVEKIMQNVTTKADAVRKSMNELDASTADNIDAMKRAVEARLTDLDEALATAKQRS